MDCLLVTASGGEKLRDLLLAVGLTAVAVRETEEEARRLLEQKTFGLVVIDAPLKDSYGREFAASLADFYEMPVMLICEADMYDGVRDKIKGKTVFLLQKPFTRRALSQSVDFISAHRIQTDLLRAKNAKLNKKLEDIKTIDRAKYLLMNYLNMSEPEAHRYIEKQAMDRGLSRREVADEILKTY